MRAWAADGGYSTSDIPDYHAANASAVAVTDATLLANETFWPYQAALTKSGEVGVLIRVESARIARIDFGRDGLRDVPVAETDLVERANRIRLGEVEKMAPNFVLAIGPRLLDASADALRPYPFATVGEKPGFVCVFADPGAPSFAKIAAALAPLGERHGVTTVLFPQGRHSDAAVREKLRAAGWLVPFVYDHLSEAYTHSLLATGTTAPAIILQTNEGRVLLQSAWRDELVPELLTALDLAFGGTPIKASAAR